MIVAVAVDEGVGGGGVEVATGDGFVVGPAAVGMAEGSMAGCVIAAVSDVGADDKRSQAAKAHEAKRSAAAYLDTIICSVSP